MVQVPGGGHFNQQEQLGVLEQLCHLRASVSVSHSGTADWLHLGHPGK